MFHSSGTNIVLTIPPNGSKPLISPSWNVVIGSPSGFNSVLFDLSFHAMGDIHTPVIPVAATTRHAVKKNIFIFISWSYFSKIENFILLYSTGNEPF